MVFLWHWRLEKLNYSSPCLIRPDPLPVRCSTARPDRVASNHRCAGLGERPSTAPNHESKETLLLSARQIMLGLPLITAISVAGQAREESKRNGHHGA